MGPEPNPMGRRDDARIPMVHRKPPSSCLGTLFYDPMTKRVTMYDRWDKSSDVSTGSNELDRSKRLGALAPCLDQTKLGASLAMKTRHYVGVDIEHGIDTRRRAKHDLGSGTKSTALNLCGRTPWS
jgi:hypothetical protein